MTETTTGTVVLIAAVIGVGALAAGFQLGGKHTVARMRYAAWRNAVMAVPLAFKAFINALMDVLGYWILTAGVAALIFVIAWKVNQ